MENKQLIQRQKRINIGEFDLLCVQYLHAQLANSHWPTEDCYSKTIYFRLFWKNLFAVLLTLYNSSKHVCSQITTFYRV